MEFRAKDKAECLGLTLIEVMIAVAILAMISSMIWTGFRQSSFHKKYIERIQERYHQVRLAMARISRDISMAYLSKNRHPLEPAWKTLFIGEDRPPFDRVDFTSFAKRRLFKDAKESDQAEISFFGASDLDNVEITNLVRRESPRIDEEPRKGGQLFVLIEDIAGFDLHYFDPQKEEWLEYWNTEEVDGQPDRLPSMVRIEITIKDEKGEDLKFMTQVMIHLKEPLIYFKGIY